MTRPRCLHPKERLYMLDAARGLTAHQSARKHGVKLNTVNSALKTAKAALGATTIANAVALAIKVGEFGTDDLKG